MTLGLHLGTRFLSPCPSVESGGCLMRDNLAVVRVFGSVARDNLGVMRDLGLVMRDYLGVMRD